MKSLFHLNKYFYKYKYKLIIGIIFVVISNLFAILPAQVVRYALDLVIDNIKTYNLLHGFKSQDVFKASFNWSVLLFGAIIVLMALLKGVFMFFMRQTIIVVSRLIEYDLKNEIFEHYQKLSLSFYRKNNTGDLMARISEDVSRVRMYIGPAIMYTVNLIVLSVLIIYTMLKINVELTLYVLTPLPILALCIYYVSNMINKKSERVQQKLSSMSTFVQEAFSGIRVIKAYTREENSIKEFEAESEDYKVKSMNLVKTNGFFAPAMLLLIGLSTLITIYVGGRQVIAGKITIGNIAEFIIYVTMLTFPVATLGWVTSLVQRAAASQTRINEFLQIKSDITSPNVASENINGNVVFSNVSFIYPDSGIVALKDVSFTLEAGKSVAILGKTGSGKSTIANLVTRMYDTTTGSITIDGKAINTINLNSLRSQIGYVPQDVFLFSDTISNNISFGIKNTNTINTELIHQAAKDAAVYSNIIELPDGFNTRIGERGITLSGGQKQRISIARAIIKEPKILIFDDCLSAVDTQTEEEILRNLRRIMQGRSSIIISHRISSVKNADHIIVLDEGKIVEEGRHNDLMEVKGIYFELYEKQLLEEETV
jgi:ATP-binding cassette subfamily B multidrug efflux pump